MGLRKEIVWSICPLTLVARSLRREAAPAVMSAGGAWLWDQPLLSAVQASTLGPSGGQGQVSEVSEQIT